MRSELAHVMLKPDTLASGLRATVLRELEESGGCIAISKRITLNRAQIEAIYPNFPNLRAKPFVFAYFTSRETEHFAFVGDAGLHCRLHEAKGLTGTGRGIRGKYYTRYTRLSQSELNEWLAGTRAESAEIDLEMFGRDILHVADNPTDSARGLRAVMSEQDIEVIRTIGCQI